MTNTRGRLCDWHFVNTIEALEALVDNVFQRHQFTTVPRARLLEVTPTSVRLQAVEKTLSYRRASEVA